MDPTATLKLLIDAFLDHRYKDAEEAANNLHHWLLCGGFAPKATEEQWKKIAFLLGSFAVGPRGLKGKQCSERSDGQSES